MRKTIETIIRETVLQILSTQNVEITSETDLLNDVGMDSLSLIMIIVSLEDRLKIEFPDDFFTEENLSKFSIFVAKIESLLNSKKE